MKPGLYYYSGIHGNVYLGLCLNDKVGFWLNEAPEDADYRIFVPSSPGFRSENYIGELNWSKIADVLIKDLQKRGKI